MPKDEAKVIVFDWGRTLHDPETDAFFPGVTELVPKLAERYRLALVSLAGSQSPEARRMHIEGSGIAPHFSKIYVGGEDKDSMYENALMDLGISPSEAIIVDDRTARGIAWGNRRGAITVWVKQGKFASELPSPETGEPAFTVSGIRELESLLLR